uniref:Patatin homolog n=1 Tax=Solanum tuberosum TaxID=4113 RepID=M1BFJ2_SOLTU
MMEKNLHKVLQDKLGETRLHQALTNVVIPTFDIKKNQPIIFTKSKLDAKMCDICYSTAAAPTCFPPHYFVTNDAKGNQVEFNLIDGSVVAANPVRN